MSLAGEISRIADQFTGAVAKKDISALRTLLADDAQVWHNTDGRWQSRAEALAAIEEFFMGALECSYSNVRRLATEVGFIQQHTLLVGFNSGGPVHTIPVCLIVEVAGDRIRRIEEYLDSSVFNRAA